MNRFILILLPVLAAAGACQERTLPARPAGAPRVCGEVRGAYCIEDMGVTVDIRRVSADTNEIVLSEDYWRNHPLRITEPATCRGSLSDTLTLLSFQNRETTSELRVRLVKDGSCDLVLTASNRRTDPMGAGFFTGLTQIRACERRPCSGRIIGGVLRQNIDW